MTKGLVLAAGIALSLLVLAPPAGAASFPSGFETRTLAYVREAIDVAWDPAGHMYVATKDGKVYVVDAPGDTPRKLLDISSHVNSYSDRGLEGIAVDSDFVHNHYLWLLYVYEPNPNTPEATGPRSSRLTRVTVHPDGSTSGETVVLGRSRKTHCSAPRNGRDCIPADDRSHMVGTVRSAPDGTLWVGSGDAANDDVFDRRSLRAYDVRSYAGKILHVDRRGRGLPGHPFCRPHGGRDNLRRVCAKVYARGFRNPYRFTLRAHGGPIAGDVGWSTREEIDLVSAGRNYGWPCYEGGAGTRHGAKTPQWRHKRACARVYSSHATTPPVLDYRHGQTAAIIGGPRFPGGAGYPGSYRGKVFFGDYAKARIETLDLATKRVRRFATGVRPVDLELAPDGDLVYVDIGAEAIREVAAAGGFSR